LGIPRAEQVLRPQQLLDMDGVFVSFTTRGIVEAESIDGQVLRKSPVTQRLQSAFEDLLARECA
jgi:branched-subunit amino acid aminotransferase/4-amino-4-deoxychorismate lyase